MLGSMIADTFIKPFQAPVFDSPENHQLDWEDVKFKAEDGVELSGWLIKGESDKVIIQSHFGVQCSRSGYTPEGRGMFKFYGEDIRFLRQARYLNEAGYSILMYDFRNHGNSAAGTLPYVSWGQEEAKDVLAAVDYISKHAEYQDASIGLLSICMGQGASISAFGREGGLRQNPRVKAMISVQPMDYPSFVRAMRLPKFLANSTGKAIRKRTGRDYDQTSWRPYVKAVNVPTLVIQNKNDGYLDEAFVNGVYEDLGVEKELLWLDLPKLKGGANPNRAAAYQWIGENPEPIVGWFNKHVV